MNETALHSTMVPVMGALAAARVTSVCMKAGLGLGLSSSQRSRPVNCMPPSGMKGARTDRNFSKSSQD